MFLAQFRRLVARNLLVGHESTSRVAALKNVSSSLAGQSLSFSTKSMKVAVLGAASKTGTCLSLYLKQSSLIDELSLYDTKPTYPMALELNHIDTRCRVTTWDTSDSSLERTVLDAKIVMIVADQHFEKRTKEETLWENAEKLSDVLPSVIRLSPRAMVAVAMNPVNSLIPLATEMYKRAGIFEYNRLFGVTSLDCVRANTFVSEAIRAEPESVVVPVIGGGCPESCVPVFSQTKPRKKLPQEEAARLTRAVRMANQELLTASCGKEASCFAMGFAAARFCVSLCKALRHWPGVVECAYVRSCAIPELKYLASPLELGPDGLQRHLGLPALDPYECQLLEQAIPVLRKAIAQGELLALGPGNPSTEFCGYRKTNHVAVVPAG